MNKNLLASNVHSGSNFVRELIRENFPEYFNLDTWSKTHKKNNLSEYYYFNVIFVISDPRDCAARIEYIERCKDFIVSNEYYNIDPELMYSVGNSKFLDLILDETIQYINHYKQFDRVLFLNYEEAFFNPNYALKVIGNFLGLEPLYIDDIEKYKHSITKNIGIFNKYYNQKELNEHYDNNKQKYDLLKYGKYGYIFNSHYILGLHNLDSYENVLKRNNIEIADELAERIFNAKLD